MLQRFHIRTNFMSKMQGHVFIEVHVCVIGKGVDGWGRGVMKS